MKDFNYKKLITREFADFSEFKNIKCIPIKELEDFLKFNLKLAELVNGYDLSEYSTEIYCIGLLLRLNKEIHFNYPEDEHGFIEDMNVLEPVYSWRVDNTENISGVFQYTFNKISKINVPKNMIPDAM